MPEPGSGEQRYSVAFSADLIADPQQRAEREARNGLLQFDLGMRIVEEWTADKSRKFKLRPSLILSLRRAALDDISAYAGNFRPAGVKIEGSNHEPPGAHLVPELIEQMCDDVNDNWGHAALHLAAYLMWRLNGVHPFADGNGRTSRILSMSSCRSGSGIACPARRRSLPSEARDLPATTGERNQDRAVLI